MDVEEGLRKIISDNNAEYLDEFLDVIVEKWLYFLFMEPEGENTPASSGNVISILTTNKENPINIPLVKNEDGTFGVLYTNEKLAIAGAEFSCKTGHMKGRKAFKLFYETKGIDSVYIVGTHGSILLHPSELKRLSKSWSIT